MILLVFLSVAPCRCSQYCHDFRDPNHLHLQGRFTTKWSYQYLPIVQVHQSHNQ